MQSNCHRTATQLLRQLTGSRFDLLFNDLDPSVVSNVAHEQNAGIHVEVECSGADRAVQQIEMGGAIGVVGYTDGEAQADEKVGDCQILQVESDVTGWKETSTEVEPQCKAV